MFFKMSKSDQSAEQELIEKALRHGTPTARLRFNCGMLEQLYHLPDTPGILKVWCKVPSV